MKTFIRAHLDVASGQQAGVRRRTRERGVIAGLKQRAQHAASSPPSSEKISLRTLERAPLTHARGDGI
jgi:hypothetical protein